MDRIIIFQGDQLKDIMELLHHLSTASPYQLSFAIDDGGLKIKLDNYGWSPAMGTEVRTGHGGTSAVVSPMPDATSGS